MKKIIGINLVTQYQISNLISFYLDNENSYDEIIVYTYNYWGESILSQSYLSRLKKTFPITFVESTFASDIMTNNELSESNVTLVTVNKPFRKAWKYFTQYDLVCIEDGIGSYTNLSRKIKSIFMERGLFSVIKYLIKAPIQNIYDEIISFERFYLFNKNLTVNESFVKAWVKQDELSEPFKLDNANEMILFCSQPLNELGYISDSDFDLLLERLYCYALNRGLKLVVKKHPVEADDKFKNYQLLDYSGPIENLFVKNKFAMFVGINSTSLLTVNAIYGIETAYITLPDIDFTGMKGLSPKQKLLFNTYSQEIKLI